MTILISADDRMTLGDGAGGRAMQRLIQDTFLRAFATDPEEPAGVIGLSAMDDGAAVRVGDQWLVLTTDSHVIRPVFFPGGDIGRLAVAGAVNDLAVMGATEVIGLTCAVVVEEGFGRADLDRILASMHAACADAGASVLTGDTKVVRRGELNGILINTTGVALTPRIVTDRGLHPGDRLIVTGTIGDHGMAMLASRHGLATERPLVSDVAPINGLIRAALAVSPEAVTAMKDPTRGGVTTALQEMAAKAQVGVLIDNAALPLSPAVRGISELTGVDPLLVGNEGKAVIGVRADAAAAVLAALHAHPLGRDAAVIGVCTAERPGMIVLDTGVGLRRLTEPEGEPLPRV